MIQTILQKCLTELNCEAPRLDYIRGMIEVLLASQEKPLTISPGQVVVPNNTLGVTNHAPSVISMTGGGGPFDESAILDAKAKASLAQVKRMSATE